MRRSVRRADLGRLCRRGDARPYSRTMATGSSWCSAPFPGAIECAWLIEFDTVLAVGAIVARTTADAPLMAVVACPRNTPFLSFLSASFRHVPH